MDNSQGREWWLVVGGWWLVVGGPLATARNEELIEGPSESCELRPVEVGRIRILRRFTVSYARRPTQKGTLYKICYSYG